MFVLVILSLVALVGLSILRGFVLSILWGWFLVPLGIPDIGVAWAIGIAATLGMLVAGPSAGSKDTAEQLGYAVGTPLMALLIGWIVTLFM